MLLVQAQPLALGMAGAQLNPWEIQGCYKYIWGVQYGL